VDGFDLSAEAIAEARNLHGAPGARFETADVGRLPCPDHSYDLFLSFETIGHLGDDCALLREAVRVLKPDGTFACSTPNRRVTNPGIPIRRRPYYPFHLREYTSRELEQLLRGLFPVVTLFGQTFRAGGYVRTLTRLGRLWPMLAVRVHQARKFVALPWETPERHRPTALGSTDEPEVLIAVCRQAPLPATSVPFAPQ
jgi:SAM-dependent methyltransferase